MFGAAMAPVNPHYQKLQAGYLFPEIGRRVAAFSKANPEARVIRLGIGDVTLPLAPAIVAAMHAAVDDLGDPARFRGYGPEQGYDFLIDAIRAGDYAARGVNLERDEIFVSDGSKCDAANLQELFGPSARVGVTDPVYPVYVDSNVMAGRTGAQVDGRYAGLTYLPGTAANGFLPEPPADALDLVYLCSPNNPTGAVASRDYLERWVTWANAHGAVIAFDAAYEAFIRDPALPRSIYEIPGARRCAIELRSFSKRAGFTGVRCAFMVVPRELVGQGSAGEEVAFRDLWARRHTTKFNGASYVVQRGAAAAYSPAGLAETMGQVDFYMENARLLRAGLQRAGFTVHGGEHAPYIWLATRDGMKSWDFFNLLLERCHVVGTPGSGFGPAGEGYFRLSAFNSRENVEEALARIARAFA